MRLLKRQKGGWFGPQFEFSLTEFGTDIPKYAILSHRWGPEEVTFKDLENGKASTKAGYKKLEFCAEQADKDGLLYFWADTCAIDKSSSAELSTAINSMYKWYENSTKCYVFLEDVSIKDGDNQSAESGWESAFRASEWFTRGWTLQELIAPRDVEFFSIEGARLGDKKSLSHLIHQITGIPIDALVSPGKAMADFKVEDRFSWAAGRKTTVEEDAAYCLFGIFNVHMPLIYGEGQQKALLRLQKEVGIPSNATAPVPSDALWIVPFERNSRFTGRESQLSQIESALFIEDYTSRLAIAGLGGTGKTQLVLELLYRTRSKHRDCTIMWIPATNSESLHQGYLEVARQLNISGWEDEKKDVRLLVQKHLSQREAGKWLLVFDNADDLELWTTSTESKSREDGFQRSSPRSIRLIDCLPASDQGSIIFTTRDMEVAVELAKQNIVELTQMSTDTAIELLSKCLVHPNLVEENATALLAELTCLPLAIIQAAAYINKKRITIADYVSLLDEGEEDVIELLSEDFEDDGRYRDSDVKNPVAATWLISFEQIRRHDPLAVEYLSFMACIDSKDIPESLLPPGPSRKKQMDSIGTLAAFSFVNRRPDSSLDLHRLVHLATRNWLRKEGLLESSTKRAFTHVSEVLPGKEYEYKNRSVWRLYLPHARYLLDSKIPENTGKEKTELMEKYGLRLYRDGRWREAGDIFRVLLETGQNNSMASPRWIMNAMNWLSASLRRDGQLEEAKKLQLRSIELSKAEFGSDHPFTLNAETELVLIYIDKNQYEEAEMLQLQVMETSIKTLGVDYPNKSLTAHVLGVIYSQQGRHTEAEEVRLEALEINKRRLGEDHPHTLTNKFSLALTYYEQGRWEESENLQMQVWEKSKIRLGDNHPETLRSMAELAITWRKLNRSMEALKLMEECLQRRILISGANHRDTLVAQGRVKQWQAEQTDENGPR
jgi:tetratricopeptide (TPR) repeat protein